MDDCDCSLCIILLLFFGYFPLKSESLWEDAETWCQGMLIASFLPCKLDGAAACAAFNVKHRNIKL